QAEGGTTQHGAGREGGAAVPATRAGEVKPRHHDAVGHAHPGPDGRPDERTDQGRHPDRPPGVRGPAVTGHTVSLCASASGEPPDVIRPRRPESGSAAGKNSSRSQGCARRGGVAGLIGVGKPHWVAAPLPPNRTGGSPASGSPVSGLTSER